MACPHPWEIIPTGLGDCTPHCARGATQPTIPSNTSSAAQPIPPTCALPTSGCDLGSWQASFHPCPPSSTSRSCPHPLRSPHRSPLPLRNLLRDLLRDLLQNSPARCGTLSKKNFALLDAFSSLIGKSTLPEGRAGEEYLKVLERPQVLSDSHQNDFQRKADKIITNVFFNKERKQKTEAVLKDKVAAFQKVKGDKR